MSNIKMYKYDWYWNKTKPVGFLNAKKMPLKDIETVSIFYENLPTYNPQGIIKVNKVKNNSSKVKKHSNISGQNGGAFKTSHYKQDTSNYPRQVLKYSIENGLHPTQKPVALIEYLIKTYTNE
jgi:site-specific DNA-methyltransferase (adenine-specific)